MKLLMLIMIFATFALADTDYKKMQQDATDTLGKMHPYQCFAELEMYPSNHIWEIPVTKHGLPHLLIMQDARGVLYLQPHPEKCEDESKPCYHYWARSFEKTQVPLRNIDVVPCPKYLNKKNAKAYAMEVNDGTINVRAFPK